MYDFPKHDDSASESEENKRKSQEFYGVLCQSIIQPVFLLDEKLPKELGKKMPWNSTSNNQNGLAQTKDPSCIKAQLTEAWSAAVETQMLCSSTWCDAMFRNY